MMILRGGGEVRREVGVAQPPVGEGPPGILCGWALAKIPAIRLQAVVDVVDVVERERLDLAVSDREHPIVAGKSTTRPQLGAVEGLHQEVTRLPDSQHPCDSRQPRVGLAQEVPDMWQLLSQGVEGRHLRACK